MGFTLSATSTTITFHVTYVTGNPTYRLFYRLASSTETTHINLTGITSDFEYTVTGLSPDTAYATNVAYWPGATTESSPTYMGSQTITTETSTRPSDWVWTTNITKGATVPKYGESLAPITAAEWNEFCNRINLFREYKDMGVYSFTTVSKGTPITAAIVNQAITAIKAISGHGTLPTPSNAISASFWQQLANALNAVS